MYDPNDIELEDQKETDWFIEVDGVDGSRKEYSKKDLYNDFKSNILSGKHQKSSVVVIHTKNKDGKWDKTTSSIIELAKGHFSLRILYQPVWAHAISGLKWGALIGVLLKLLDTLILVFTQDVSLAVMFLFAIGVCFIPRYGIIAVIVLSIATAKYSNVNLFMMGLSAALIGSILGCLPGMTIGGIIGIIRKGSIRQASDATPEPHSMVVKAVLLPFTVGCALFAFYIFVFNPWIVKFIE